MILYLDTSAFLKLYLEEPDSQIVREALADAAFVCTHLIAYAEMRASFAQAVRMRRISRVNATRQRARFETDWSATQIILVDETLMRRAGELAESYQLRGYDSVHLAAAERTYVTVRGPEKIEFRFACFDSELRQAALVLGLPGLD